MKALRVTPHLMFYWYFRYEYSGFFEYQNDCAEWSLRIWRIDVT